MSTLIKVDIFFCLPNTTLLLVSLYIDISQRQAYTLSILCQKTYNYYYNKSINLNFVRNHKINP